MNGSPLEQLIGRLMIELVVYEFGSTSTFEGDIKLAIYNPFEIKKATVLRRN